MSWRRAQKFAKEVKHNTQETLHARNPLCIIQKHTFTYTLYTELKNRRATIQQKSTYNEYVNMRSNN